MRARKNVNFGMPMMGVLGFDMGYGFDAIDNSGDPPGWNYTIIFGIKYRVCFPERVLVYFVNNT